MGEAGDSEEQGAGEAESGRRRREWERLGAADADRPALGRRGSGRKAKSVQGKKQGLKRKKQEQERLRREDNTGPSDNF